MKKNYKKLGFTLIELLVVIVILAIVALITTPIVLDVIESATDKANRSSAYGIMETAKLYRIEQMFKDNPVPTDENILSTLKIKGSKPKDGDVRVNANGYIAIALKYGNKCYTKAYEDEDLTVVDNAEECKIEDGSTPDPNVPGFDIVKEVNKPQLIEGMTPIKWDAGNNNWVNTTFDDDEWYDYTNKKWANVKTVDGSFWVWIPRYAYKMNGQYHNGGNGISSSFDIKFLKGQTNKAIDNTVIETEGYIGDLDSNPSSTKNTKNNYFLHPSFQNDNVLGFWVAKFEPSGNVNNIKIVPNVSSLRNTKIGDLFTAGLNMKNNVMYGWNSSKVDTHMMTNLEWGAVAYLSHSIYGKNSEITGSSCSNVYITGGGTGDAYKTNTAQSTTGNTTGIYDMSGGTQEYVSSYVNNEHSYLTTNGNSIIIAGTKYKNIYVQGSTDNQASNYMVNKDIYGDAVWETSNGSTSMDSWNGNTSFMVALDTPFFKRSNSSCQSYLGIFSFANSNGAGDVNGSDPQQITFRPIVSVIP